MPNAHGKIIANTERLHRLMDEEGVSAIVARSGKNFTYLSGFAYPGTLARHLEFPDSPREVLLVWPRTGEPVMVLNSYAAPLARRDSWLERIEVYDDYAESPYQRVADMVGQLGLTGETVGFEKSYISANRWEEITALLPNARLVDSTELMDRVRWIKTPEEVAALEAGARLLDEAYLEVLPTVRPGDTERLVHSRIIEGCLRRGANWAPTASSTPAATPWPTAARATWPSRPATSSATTMCHTSTAIRATSLAASAWGIPPTSRRRSIR